MAWRRCSAVEAGEPDESAAEEKLVEEKEADRKGERTGSLANESRREEGVATAVDDGCGEAEGFLKVERRWNGEEAADAAISGDRSRRY